MQHQPTSQISNVREISLQFVATVPTEQFFILRGRHEAYISGDLVDRATVISDVAEDVENLRQVIAIDLANGTSRDATDDITSVVIRRWAEDGKELSRKQRDFVAMCKGEAFANCFRLEECA